MTLHLPALAAVLQIELGALDCRQVPRTSTEQLVHRYWVRIPVANL